jgi:hypothetical protein
VDRIGALDEAAVRNAVGPYLTDDEIGALMARKPILLAEIADRVKREGEKAVLYEP